MYIDFATCRLSRFLAMGLRELGERGKSADVLHELSRLTETSEPEASLTMAHTSAAASAEAAVVWVSKSDESARTKDLNNNTSSPDDTGQSHVVIEAALVAFKGEKRRAGRAHRVLRATTAEQSKVSTHSYLHISNARKVGFMVSSPCSQHTTIMLDCSQPTHQVESFTWSNALRRLSSLPCCAVKLTVTELRNFPTRYQHERAIVRHQCPKSQHDQRRFTRKK